MNSKLMVLAGAGMILLAQAPLTFEVAAIKPADPQANGSSFHRRPDGLSITNCTVKQIAAFAFDVREFQLSGGPGWFSSERFDILAKSESTGAPADAIQMTDGQRRSERELIGKRLQALLADRFKMVTHTETKELPIYALTVAKNGLKVHDSKAGNTGNQSMSTGRGQMRGTRASMELLANSLSNMLSRPVLNQTGIPWNFDFKLDWTPDTLTGADGAAAQLGPSIFTALQEQLGLKLESTRGPVPVIVIDRLEKPTEN